ncbi:MAG: hypothetical protein ACHP7D_09630 [Lysobacterales bacterium]
MTRSLLCATLLALTLPQPARASDAPTKLRTDAPGDFLPEGLEWDAHHRRFLLSSIRLHRIDAIDPRTGHAQRFADAPGSVLGLHVAPDGRSVWATWTAFGTGFTHNRGTGIVAWSLDDAHRLGAWPLPDRDPRATLGDLLILDAHTLVTSDSGTGAIYRFDKRSHHYARIVAAGQFASPQGIAAGRAAGTVYLADYDSGLWRITLADGSRHALATPPGIELRGIDGLYRVGDNLIGVQNGTRTHRILWIALGDDDAVARVDKLAEGRPDWDEPSLGSVVGARFWFNATSQWSRFDGELHALPGIKLQSPLLDSVALPQGAATAAGR